MLLVAALIACSEPAPAPPVAPPATDVAPAAAAPDAAPPDADTAAVAAARGAAKKLGGTLKERLGEALKDSPSAAVTACADEAQGLTALIHAETGARVGRGSLRLRNPANTPPEWVSSWLVDQGERPADGVTGIERVEEVDGKRVARVLVPIRVEPMCETCHGAAIAPDVAAVLAQRYPNDRATGYAAGDLRGALWAEVPVSGATGR